MHREPKLDAQAASAPSTCDQPTQIREHLGAFSDRDAWDTLNRLLVNCPIEQREVYLKIELHGMTAGELAEELGISVNTVHSRLRLTRQRLRESSAALAALLVLLREQLMREGVSLPPTMSSPSQLASVGESKQPMLAGLSGKAALIAFLLLPASDSRHDKELRLEDPEAAVLTEQAHARDSVHTRSIQVPWVQSRPLEMGARLTLSEVAPEPTTTPPLRRRASLRRANPSLPVPGPQRQNAPLDDGESLLQGAETAYRGRRFDQALKYALRHRRLYPASELRYAREILIASALCRLGRDREARMHVRMFSRESPEERVFRARLAQLPEECR